MRLKKKLKKKNKNKKKKLFLGNHTVAIIKGSESYEILQT
jgi:hypothetical protein